MIRRSAPALCVNTLRHLMKRLWPKRYRNAYR
jgi:hypothetical protein